MPYVRISGVQQDPYTIYPKPQNNIYNINTIFLQNANNYQ